MRTQILQDKYEIKKVVKNSLNAIQFPKDHELNTLPSETIPDQSMSVAEIMSRHTRGLPVLGARVATYDELENDDDLSVLPDPRTLDLAERQELKEQFESELKDIRKKQETPKQEPKKEYPKKTASPEGGREGEKNDNSSSDGGSGADASKSQGAAASDKKH